MSQIDTSGFPVRVTQKAPFTEAGDSRYGTATCYVGRSRLRIAVKWDDDPGFSASEAIAKVRFGTPGRWKNPPP